MQIIFAAFPTSGAAQGIPIQSGRIVPVERRESVLLSAFWSALESNFSEPASG